MLRRFLRGSVRSVIGVWGYGSHAFLDAYIHDHTCRRIMEIGVFDGDNARRMVEAASQRVLSADVEYYGFDFFTGSSLHDVAAKLKGTGCRYQLFKGDTVDTLPATAPSLPLMDVIFIDGGKSFTEAQSDWECSKPLMHRGTAVFVHNYEFSSVRRMVDGVNRDAYRVSILHPPGDAATAMITTKRYASNVNLTR